MVLIPAQTNSTTDKNLSYSIPEELISKFCLEDKEIEPVTTLLKSKPAKKFLKTLSSASTSFSTFTSFIREEIESNNAEDSVKYEGRSS